MRYLLTPLIDEDYWDGLPEDEQGREMAAFRTFGGALREAGALVGNYRPQPSAQAKTVRLVEGQPQVQDGPHGDLKEQPGGLYIIDVPDLAAALEWAGRAPAARYGVIEVRPIAGGQP